MQNIIKVLQDPDASEYMRGALVVWLKKLGATEQEIVDQMLKQAVWSNKNAGVTQRKVHKFFTREYYVYAEESINQYGYTYTGTADDNRILYEYIKDKKHTYIINNKESMLMEGFKKTTLWKCLTNPMFNVKPSRFKTNDFGITVFRIDCKLNEEQRQYGKQQQYVVHKFIGHVYHGCSPNVQIAERDAILELTVAQNSALLKAVSDALKAGIEDRIPLDAVIFVKPQGKGNPEVKVITQETAQAIKNLTDIEIRDSIFGEPAQEIELVPVEEVVVVEEGSKIQPVCNEALQSSENNSVKQTAVYQDNICANIEM